MGSPQFLTYKQAGERLGLCKRSVLGWVKKGHLRSYRPEGRARAIGVYTEDVEAMEKARDLESLPVAVNQETLLRLYAQIRMLQQQMQTVFRVLNLRNRSLDAKDQELAALYHSAQQYSIEGWPPHTEEMWASTLMQITLDDMAKLKKLTDDPQPWRPFYRLAATAALCPYDKDLKELFVAGRENVYGIAKVMNEVQGDMSAYVDVITKDAAPLKKLLTELAKKTNAIGT